MHGTNAPQGDNVDETSTGNAKTDLQLKRDIEEELRWDPKINEAQIAVGVDEGVVTLRGTVDAYPGKWAAEAACKRVRGVRTVDERLGVKLAVVHERHDSEVADTVRSALRWDVLVPDQVTASVKNGVVTLEGLVTWNFQRAAAQRAVGHLAGVTGVENQIALHVMPTAEIVRDEVEAALHRQAKTDTKSITIDVSGGKVTLSGYASSWQAIEDAREAAWGAPGVTEVVDHVQIATTI
jgi:osmotically-inducible protein OsmY